MPRRFDLDEIQRKLSGPNPPAPAGEPGTPGESGADGDPGEPGAPGDAATISIGSVSTLSPGSSATVSNSGTSNAAVLDFGIPAGAPGSGGVFDSGSEDPNGNIYSPEPTDGSIYIRTSIGAYIYIASLSPHWRQFAS